MNKKQDVVIYQARNGSIEFRGDGSNETIWASLDQIAELFGRDKSVISRHLRNIFNEKELERKAVVAKKATTASDGKTYQVEYFNLDAILSVGYRVNSKTATQFRQWANKTLKQHIVDGYTINRKRIGKNYEKFIQSVNDVKKLLPQNDTVSQEDTLELIKFFAGTWFSLDAYDKSKFSKKGLTKKKVSITAEQLCSEISILRKNLITKDEATDIFAQEREKGSVAGIVGNVFQGFAGKDVYPTVEEKAAHLLYFMVKNHPFVDGNKRSGAFSFVWFLNHLGMLDKREFSPEALTTLTILVAESDPKEKDRMTGLILNLLR